MANDSTECFTEVRKAKNLYSKDLHYRAVERSEFVSVRGFIPPGPGLVFPSEPVLKYFYISHCKGYRWSYVPNPKTSSALYVEYSELKDLHRVGDLFYGVFSTPLASEQLHTFNTNPDTAVKPNIASAICTFSLSDIQSTFNGPFKKRDKSTGVYRPFGKKDVALVQPSPYSREQDEEAQRQASSIQDMNLNFLDSSQPYSEEIKRVDLRRNSSRLNFFEEDIFGSRTMWDDVKTLPLLSEAGVVFDKIVTQSLDESTMMYVSTNDGDIYKILNTPTVKSTCKMTSKTEYIKWLNTTEYMSSIWDNEVYAYLNRTIDKVTFTTSFQSDLTMEKETKFPDDMLLKSDWDCTPSMKTTILAVLKPFGKKKMKIWDMKLAGEGSSSQLVLSTDEQVLQIPTVQCSLYTHCKSCVSDPYCSWDELSCKNVDDISSKEQDIDVCSCQVVLTNASVAEDVILTGLSQSVDPNRIQWYHNDTAVVYKTSRVMLAHDTSLILFNVTPANSGTYQLRDVQTNECLAKHYVSLNECNDEVCRYELKYQQWCNEYDDFHDRMKDWYRDYGNYGYCSNL